MQDGSTARIDELIANDLHFSVSCLSGSLQLVRPVGMTGVCCNKILVER